MLLSPVRIKKKVTVKKADEGKGKQRTAVEEGIWVKTIVLIRPSRRASGAAKTVLIEERI